MHNLLASRDVRMVLADVPDPVHEQLEKYGISQLVGIDANLPTVADVLDRVTSAGSGHHPEEVPTAGDRG